MLAHVVQIQSYLSPFILPFVSKIDFISFLEQFKIYYKVEGKVQIFSIYTYYPPHPCYPPPLATGHMHSLPHYQQSPLVTNNELTLTNIDTSLISKRSYRIISLP